jgi:competence protein ComEC
MEMRATRFLWMIASILLFVATTVTAQPRGDQYLRISFIDVGQGDAIWIQTPTAPNSSPGKNIIIDGGPDRHGKNRVVAYLTTYGLPPGSTIDYVIATHPHTDHYPGLIDLLEQYDVRTIIDSGFPKEGPEFAAFVHAAETETIGGQKSQFIKLRNQPVPVLDWGVVTAEILYAEKDLPDLGQGNDRENNASTVIKLTFGKFSFLLMGDGEGKERNKAPNTSHFVEEILLKKFQNTPDKLHATVLKAGHHGSETGSTGPFLAAVKPDVVVVMSGRRSFNGTFLPDTSVLSRYTALGTTVVRTDFNDAREHRDTTNDADGDDIYIYTNGDTLRLYQARGPQGARRWTRLRTIQE